MSHIGTTGNDGVDSINIGAEIGSNTINEYTYGYWLGSPVTEENTTTKYIHHERVDGNETYGVAHMGFPRRNMVGGYYIAYAYTENVIQSPGSRCMVSNVTPGSVFGNASARGCSEML